MSEEILTPVETEEALTPVAEEKNRGPRQKQCFLIFRAQFDQFDLRSIDSCCAGYGFAHTVDEGGCT